MTNHYKKNSDILPNPVSSTTSQQPYYSANSSPPKSSVTPVFSQGTADHLRLAVHIGGNKQVAIAEKFSTPPPSTLRHFQINIPRNVSSEEPDFNPNYSVATADIDADDNIEHLDYVNPADKLQQEFQNSDYDIGSVKPKRTVNDLFEQSTSKSERIKGGVQSYMVIFLSSLVYLLLC